MGSVASTLYEMFQGSAGRFTDRPCLRFKSQGVYQTYTYSYVLSFVQDLAHFLLSQGIQKGDRVGLLSENRPEWAISDLSILAIGAVTVPIYPTLSASEVAFILKDSGCRLLFLSTPELEKVKDPSLPKVLFDTYPQTLRQGGVYGQQNPSALEGRSRSIQATDLATILYTSGTTGEPKGVMLTHGNLLSNCEACRKVLPIFETDVYLSFLPLSHIFERMAGHYFMLMHGACIAYAESLERVTDNMREVQPTLIAGVPRFFEKFHEGILQKIHQTPQPTRSLALWALGVGRKKAEVTQHHQAISPWLSLRFFLATLLVLRRLRQAIAPRLRFFISGSAPLSPDLIAFFASFGCSILEGYGLTETSPVVSFNRPGQAKWGSVGQILPGVEVKIAEDGEILVKGPNVMRGYFGKPRETEEVFEGGYLKTGDIGTLDKEGYLFITDRKKDLIKTSGGKLIAPQKIEALLKADPFIQEAVVYGDRQKYLVVLLCPNFERLEAYAKGCGLGARSRQELLKHPEVLSLFEKRLEACQGELARFEKVKRFALLDQPLSQSEGELTPTLKVKRKVLAEKYRSLLTSLYTDQ